MKVFLTVILGISHLLFFAELCYAGSEHEMYVGAQKEQMCSASTLAIVGQFLNINGFKVSPDGGYPNQESIIAASACKTSPANSQITIVAVAYEAEKEYAKALVIAFVDNASGKVFSSFNGEIGEDAAMRVDSGSLWIDTANYKLRNGVRAFGLDVTSGYIHHCGEGGSGAVRSLYVHEGKTIRPVLDGLIMSYWTFIQEGRSSCTSPDAPEETTVENFDLSISVSKATTKGYNDLTVSAFASRDDGKKQHRKPFHFKLRYDGRKYPAQEMQEAFWKWRS